MENIKQYSSTFATKLNFITENYGGFPDEVSKLRLIKNITKEKTTTINNWLFNNKLPQNSKKLHIADSVGVSYDYLYNDNISVTDFTKPKVYYDGIKYLIPVLEYDDILILKASKVLAITKRMPLMLPNFNTFIEKYGGNIYATSFEKIRFGDYILPKALIIFSEKVVLEHFKLVIHVLKSDTICIKRVVNGENGFNLEYFDEKGRRLMQNLIDSDKLRLLSILFAYNT